MSQIINYRVIAGDTLYGISKKFNMGIDDLKSLNGLTSNNLSIGQVLKVRGTGTTTPVPPPPPPPSPNTGSGYMGGRQGFAPEIVTESGYKRYFIRVPISGGGTVLANLRDNINSQYMVYPKGVMYKGQSQIELSTATIQAVGLNYIQARALQHVSTHEGCFDAINSYDKAIFSYGFIQFTGSAAVGASLNRLLANMEANAPTAFSNIFKKIGIDSEGIGKNAIVTVLDAQGRKLSGDAAWLYIQQNINLCGAFIQAGFEPSLIREQLRTANELYVQLALNAKIEVNAGGIKIAVPKLQDIIKSEAGTTAMISLGVNQGIGGMSRIFAAAIGQVASNAGLKSLSALTRVDESNVLLSIKNTATDQRVLNRINAIFDEEMSFSK